MILFTSQLMCIKVRLEWLLVILCILSLNLFFFAADFFDSDEYVSSIIVNGHHIIDICNPNLDCMSFYYSCIIALDVSLYVDSYQNLNVSTVATDSVDNCPFKVCLSECTASCRLHACIHNCYNIIISSCRRALTFMCAILWTSCHAPLVFQVLNLVFLLNRP